ncbi:MAG: peptidase, partial [Lachnospiraceae bacterium]|nr:peptidase [Candidatus Equihabitans merdae]
IYDRNGQILATNKLAYSLTITDAGTYETNREKALALNSEAYKISKILQSHGDHFSNDFHVVLDGAGNYTYNVSGRTLLRFKADVFGRASIDDLKDNERNASAEEMMAYLVSEERFAIIREQKPYSASELEAVGLPTDLTKEEILDITYVRYQLFTKSYQKYVPVTIATSLSLESVAELEETASTLTGIEVREDSIRVYEDPEAFASVIGYTGSISAEELTVYQEENPDYDSTYIVGKSGIEKVCELYLQGTDGSQTVYVDNLGKVREVDEDSLVESVAGNDVYLTLDKDMQVVAYQVLEQRIAGILESIIINEKTFDKSNLIDASYIRIPVYDVYNALIANSVIDTSQFAYAEASQDEKAMLAVHDQKQAEVFAAVANELLGSDNLPYSSLTEEMQEYVSYIVNKLLIEKTGILNKDAIDTEDEVYKNWNEGLVSLKDYLNYAASQNWIDISAIATSDRYLSSDEIYSLLSDYINEYLSTDSSFDKILYKYMLQTDMITPSMIINVLYDQGILSTEDEDYEGFKSGTLPEYELIIHKIHNLEITPAMLALEPCSGSMVVTDPTTGEILVNVSYPGYDNNRLSNGMDVAYYNRLINDGSSPLFNRATQQTTAPGSTFKLVTTAAGMEEGVIDSNTVFICNGVFDLTDTPLRCWEKDGHGILNIVGGIENSCNVYFSNVAYQLGLNDVGAWSDSLSLSKMQNYAKLFDLDKPSGIEIQEASPHVSDQYAIQTSIGQGTHGFTTTQLARYASTRANKGTSFNISIIDKITDTNGQLIEDRTPSISSELSLSQSTWDAITQGMRRVIEVKAEFFDMGVNVSGKTGTAQVSTTHPNHALFIGFAPSESPTMAVAVRIENGYSSTNAMLAAKDMITYRFNLGDKEDILSGQANTEDISQQTND